MSDFSVFQLAEALDKTFENLNQPADYKELKGKDPPTVELLHKIQQVNKTNAVQGFGMVKRPWFLKKKKVLFWVKNLTDLLRKFSLRKIWSKISHNAGFMWVLIAQLSI